MVAEARRFILSLEPRVRPSRASVPDRDEPPPFFREAAIEVVPGVWVSLLGIGDQIAVAPEEPDGYVVMRGAKIAVWDERAGRGCGAEA